MRETQDLCVLFRRCEPPIFKRLFLSFYAQKVRLLRVCMCFIRVDGCHLKGTHKGILLSSITVDGNNGVFPLVMAMVEAKNKYTWAWFFRNLCHYFEHR